MQRYFPSCNFTADSPEAAKKIKEYMAQKMSVSGCCRFDNKYTFDDTALYFCQACREVLEKKMDTYSIWQYLDAQSDFVWPDYSGLKADLQDCWRDREHPEIHKAVRNILKKMHIDYVEMAENKEKSVFCGDLHFEPETEETKLLKKSYGDAPVFEYSEDDKRVLMREEVNKLSTGNAICYCNRCKKGIIMGGGKSVHLMTLAMGTFDGWK
jgi:hypothetical protein